MSLFFTGIHIYIDGRRIPKTEKFMEVVGTDYIILQFRVEDDAVVTIDRFMNGSCLESKDTTFGALRATGRFRCK